MHNKRIVRVWLENVRYQICFEGCRPCWTCIFPLDSMQSFLIIKHFLLVSTVVCFQRKYRKLVYISCLCKSVQHGRLECSLWTLLTLCVRYADDAGLLFMRGVHSTGVIWALLVNESIAPSLNPRNQTQSESINYLSDCGIRCFWG